MAVTYSVTLQFVRNEEGVAPREVQDMPNEGAAIRRAESLSRDPRNASAFAFRRNGDPNTALLVKNADNLVAAALFTRAFQSRLLGIRMLSGVKKKLGQRVYRPGQSGDAQGDLGTRYLCMTGPTGV
jgi:hypothetical protein